jgi:transcriptional regulator with XRE-family HTH domain
MGFSQKRVAYFLGFKGTNAISRYEHGAKLPNLANALKLEIVYRIPVAFLFADLYKRLKKEIRGREEKLKKDIDNEE